GASGAVAGCAGYYSLRYLQLKIPFAPRISSTVMVVTLVWLALQVVGAFIQIGQGPAQVSFWSHIGGFLMGLIISVVFRAPDIAQIRAQEAQAEELRLRSPGVKLQVA